MGDGGHNVEQNEMYYIENGYDVLPKFSADYDLTETNHGFRMILDRNERSNSAHTRFYIQIPRNMSAFDGQNYLYSSRYIPVVSRWGELRTAMVHISTVFFHTDQRKIGYITIDDGSKNEFVLTFQLPNLINT